MSGAKVRLSSDLEEAYVQAVLCGRDFDGEDDQNDFRCHTKDSGDLEHEAVKFIHDIQNECLARVRNEEVTYERLEPLQLVGKLPRYLSTVLMMPTDSHLGPLNHRVSSWEYISIPGCLTSRVEGRGLRGMRSFVPKADWLYVASQATLAINQLGDFEVINKNPDIHKIFVQMSRRTPCSLSLSASTHEWNYDVVQGGSHTGLPPIMQTHSRGAPEYLYNIVMTDFCHARVRRPEENLLNWRRAKYTADEEGSVGSALHDLCGLLPFPRPGAGTRRYFEPDTA